MSEEVKLPQGEKLCTNCDAIKILTDFPARRNVCKVCVNQAKKEKRVVDKKAISQITEPVEKLEIPPAEIDVEAPKVKKVRNSITKINKEEFLEDVKTMNKKALSEKYGVVSDTINSWIKKLKTKE